MNNQYPFLENRAYSLRHSLTARNLLIFSVVMLIFIGLMMVASASMPYAEKEGLSAYNFIQKQGIFLMLSLLVGTLVYKFSGSFLNYSHSSVLLIGASLLGFILVLLVGKDIKGAKRWIDIGFFSVQVSEFVKFFWVLLLADFAVQRGKYIRKGVMYVQHFWVWLAALMVIIGLLAFQRDMGTVMAYVAISLAILFIAEIPWKELLISVAVVIMISAVGLLVADYRVSRILSVSNPFESQDSAGYQASNSVMAYVRGDWTGVGLGQSIQKLSYLPEAHNDFILAILGEEFGFLGIIVVLALLSMLISSCMYIGWKAFKSGYFRYGYAIYGISLFFAGQAMVNYGMTISLFPTKGFTLPFVSYGGSSLMASSMMVAFVLYVDKCCQYRLQPTDREIEDERIAQARDISKISK